MHVRAQLARGLTKGSEFSDIQIRGPNDDIQFASVQLIFSCITVFDCKSHVMCRCGRLCMVMYILVRYLPGYVWLCTS